MTNQLKKKAEHFSPESLITELETVMDQYKSGKISVDFAARQRVELEEKFIPEILSYYFSKVDLLKQKYRSGNVAPYRIDEKREALQNKIKILEDKFYELNGNLEMFIDEAREMTRKENDSV